MNDSLILDLHLHCCMTQHTGCGRTAFTRLGGLRLEGRTSQEPTGRAERIPCKEKRWKGEPERTCLERDGREKHEWKKF